MLSLARPARVRLLHQRASRLCLESSWGVVFQKEKDTASETRRCAEDLVQGHRGVAQAQRRDHDGEAYKRRRARWRDGRRRMCSRRRNPRERERGSLGSGRVSRRDARVSPYRQTRMFLSRSSSATFRRASLSVDAQPGVENRVGFFATGFRGVSATGFRVEYPRRLSFSWPGSCGAEGASSRLVETVFRPRAPDASLLDVFLLVSMFFLNRAVFAGCVPTSDTRVWRALLRVSQSLVDRDGTARSPSRGDRSALVSAGSHALECASVAIDRDYAMRRVSRLHETSASRFRANSLGARSALAKCFPIIFHFSECHQRKRRRSNSEQLKAMSCHALRRARPRCRRGATRQDARACALRLKLHALRTPSAQACAPHRCCYSRACNAEPSKRSRPLIGDSDSICFFSFLPRRSPLRQRGSLRAVRDYFKV